MKIKFKSLLIANLLVITGIALHAEEKSASTAPAPSAGLLNDYLREKNDGFSQWDFGGQFRARLEHKEFFAAAGNSAASVDFATKGDADNTYLLLREKIHLGYMPCSFFTTLVEGRDSSSQNDDRNPNVDSDTFDLYQGYLKIGDPTKFPLSLKVGRQELQYGDERLIGNADFNNVPRSFDAAKLRYEDKNLWVDAFFSRPVVACDNSLNQDNEHDNFSGIYASTKALVPKQETQFYFLARNTEVTSAGYITNPLAPLPSPRDIYTVGGRLKSLPGALNGWDYEVEGAYQFGRFKDSNTSKSLNQDAFATHVAGGYTASKIPGTPRVGLEYNYASGDSNPNDNTHGTFDNLFPTNHKFYGYMDFVSWQNIHDLRFTSTIKPLSKLTLNADVHGFWLADNNDSFYSVSGAARKTGGYGIKPAAGDFIGTEIDLIATYAVTSYATIQGGFGHFFVGEYVENSLAKNGGSTDANWLYLQTVFNF